MASILLKFVSDITLEFRFPKIRILDPTNSRVPRPYGVVLPSSGTPFLVVFPKILLGIPPHLNFVFIQISLFFIRATPRCASAGYAHCQLIVFTRFYPIMGPAPELLYMFSCFLTNMHSYLLVHITRSKPSRVCSDIISSAYTRSGFSSLFSAGILYPAIKL